MKHAWLLLALVLASMVPGAQAAQEHTSHSGGGQQMSVHVYPITEVANRIDGGDLIMRVTYPTVVANDQSTFTVGVSVSGPVILGTLSGADYIVECIQAGTCSTTPITDDANAALTGFYFYGETEITLQDVCETGFTVEFTLNILLLDAITIHHTGHVTAISCPTYANNNIEGHLDLDVLSIPDLAVYIEDFPELFASVTISQWGDLVTAIQGLQELNVLLDGALDINAILSGTVGIAIDDFQDLVTAVEGIEGTTIENLTANIGNLTNEDSGTLVWRKTDQGARVDPVLPILFILGFIGFIRLGWPASALTSLISLLSTVIYPWPFPWEWFLVMIFIVMVVDVTAGQEWWNRRQEERKQKEVKNA